MEISQEEFMEELLRLKLQDFSPPCRWSDLTMVSRPSKAAPDGTTNCIFEGTDKLMTTLLEAEGATSSGSPSACK